MKEGWKYMSLGEICDFISGFTPKKEELNSESGIPYFKVSDMNRLSNSLYLTETELFVKKAKKIIPANSIVFPKNGGAIFTGKKRILAYDSIVDLNTEAIKINNNNVLLTYLFQYLLFVDFGQFDNGGGLPSINIKKMKEHIIPVPSLSDQQRIVSYLDAEFAKIEALKANAEKQLQAAKDLFQAALKELLTPKEGWKEGSIGDFLTFKRGYDLTHAQMQGGDIPVAGSNGIIGYHNIATNISPCITVGRSGSVGKLNIYDKCWAHNTTLYVEDFKGNYPYFLVYLIQSLGIASYGGGSAVPTLNRNNIHPIKTAVPKFPEQQRIADRLDALSANVKALQSNYTETITLCNDLKQSLLKKIFE